MRSLGLQLRRRTEEQEAVIEELKAKLEAAEAEVSIWPFSTLQVVQMQ